MGNAETPSTNRVDQPQEEVAGQADNLAEGIDSEFALNDPWGYFLKKIGETPLLTADQEKELSKRIQEGDSAAKEYMMRANLRLVVHMAKPYFNKGISPQELVNTGTIGLSRAAEKFEAARGFRFTTYASPWIRQAIEKHFKYKNRLIHIPADVVVMIDNVYGARQRIAARQQREATIEEVAHELGTTAEEVEKLDQLFDEYFRIVSTDTPLDTEDGDGDMTILDLYKSPEQTDEIVVDLDFHRHKHEVLNEALLELSERQREILIRHYGFNGREPETLVKIGADLGISSRTVGEIVGKARTTLANNPDFVKIFKEEAA